MTPDLVEDILEALRFHPSVEAWDEPGTIVSMTTASAPCALKVAEISPDEETIAGYDLRTKTFVVWRFSQISDVKILER